MTWSSVQLIECLMNCWGLKMMNFEQRLRQRAEKQVDRNDRMTVQPTQVLRLLDQLDDLRDLMRQCCGSDQP